MFVYIFAQMSEYVGFCFQGAVIFLEALVLLRSITLKIKVKFQSQSEAFVINMFGK